MAEAVDPPTADQCSAREVVEIEGRRGVALWWPQMGGYVGKVVIFADPGGGADVLVWHDGNFPFDGICPNCGDDRRPARIYVTDPAGWIRFGRDAELALEKLTGTDPETAGESAPALRAGNSHRARHANTMLGRRFRLSPDTGR